MSAVPHEQEIEDAAAGERTARLLTIIREAECEQTLDWLERKVEREGWGAIDITVAFKRRRAEIANQPARLF